jgi:hypothetical protein
MKIDCSCSEPVTLVVTRSEESVELHTKKTPYEMDEENYKESAEFKKRRYKDFVKMNKEENYVKNDDENRNRNDRKDETKITGFFKVKKPRCLVDRCRRFGAVSKLTELIEEHAKQI